MYRAVNLLFVDQIDQVLPGVHAKVFTTSMVGVASGTSDANGLVPLLLPDGVYEIRHFTEGVVARSTKLVVEGSGVEITVRVDKTLPGEATDPRYCRIYEHFAAPDGAEIEGEVTVLPFEPVTATPSSLYPFAPLRRTLRKGLVEFSLVRGRTYAFSLPAVEGTTVATVPDQGKARLSDILFPYITKVLAASTSFTVAVGQLLEIPIDALRSDGAIPRPEELAYRWVFDSTLIQVGTIQGKVCVTGVRAGTATLSLRNGPLVEGTSYPVQPSIQRNHYPEPANLPWTFEVTS